MVGPFIKMKYTTWCDTIDWPGCPAWMFFYVLSDGTIWHFMFGSVLHASVTCYAIWLKAIDLAVTDAWVSGSILYAWDIRFIPFFKLRYGCGSGYVFLYLLHSFPFYFLIVPTSKKKNSLLDLRLLVELPNGGTVQLIVYKPNTHYC